MEQSYTHQDILDLDRVFRLNLINSVTGFKPAVLIATKSRDGQENVAIFSSVVHLGSTPPLIGFIMRPTTVPRQTLEYILDTKYYTINQVQESFIEQAHYTSAKFEEHESEFERCNLKASYKDGFHAPYVEASQLKMGLKLEQTIDIALNGTILVIGSIQHLYIEDSCLQSNGRLRLDKLGTVAIGGLNKYNRVEEIAEFPYARVHELPDFNL